MYRLLTYISKYLPFLIEFYSKWKAFFIRKSSKKNLISVINTLDQGGGAAKIALDSVMHSSLSDRIHFFVQQKKSGIVQVHELKKLNDSKFQRWIDEMERIGGWLDISKISPLQLLHNNFYRQSQIVHLHNTHGYYFSYAILPALTKKKKVIWTLHDEQLLTGHCSCTLQCNRWQQGCGNCPHLDTYPAVKIDNTKALLKYKAKWLKEVNPLIVCPSHWLAGRVRIAFPFLQKVQVIPNGVDTSVYIPGDKTSLREELNLPADAFILLFAAELSTNNPFKGGEIIHQLMQNGLGENTIIITIGGDTKAYSSSHIPYGYISSEEQMAQLYTASDLMIYPTKADNLPLVVLEAMSCGLPVIASRLGGIPEIISDGIDGFIVDSHWNIQSFQEIIERFKRFEEKEKIQIREKAREKILEKFSMKKMIQEYDKLYLSL